jgi:dihydrolipoamide dehydrogenase
MADIDLLVLGGGTGGYVAAIRAAQLGLRVALVEKEKVGGTCLHRGCIPSKTLLRSAEVMHTVRQAASYGVRTQSVELDFPGVVARKDKVVGQIYKGVQGLLKKNGVTIYEGTGVLMPPSIFAPSGLVAVKREGEEPELLSPDKIILATGSRPRTMGVAIDGHHFLTSDEALLRPELPASIVIVGGGIIGMEWSSLYNDFGVQVALLEYMDRIIPTEDEEVSAEMHRLMKRRGVDIHTSARVLFETARVEEGQAVIEAEVGGERRRFAGESILLSVGRAPNSEGLGLEQFDKVKVDKNGFVQVDGHGRTGDRNIYAIGDLVGGGLAHVAAHQGIIAVETIKGLDPHPFNPHQVARCIYTRPEAASIGLTEREAREKGYSVKVGKFPFRGIGKAVVQGDPDGFAKLVVDEATGDLLGAHLIGPHVTDYIAEAALAQVLNASGWEIGKTIHPHPTLSEVLGEAALAVEGRAIHI